MLRVFYADIRDLPDEAGKLALSAYRKEKLLRQKNAHNRRQGIGAELLLIEAIRSLGREISMPLSIQAGGGGKPSLNDGMVFFNLSHSGNYALCAISDQELGADVQVNSTYRADLASRFFSLEEQQYLQRASDPDDAFARLWTLKESYIKAKGEGLRIPLQSFTVRMQDDGVVLPVNGAGFWYSRIPGAHIAVCTLNEPEPSPEIFQERKLL